MSTVPMLAPDGTPGDVPQERVPDALKAGFKIGAELTAPNGQQGIIPTERLHDAIRAGFMLKGAAPAKPQVNMQYEDMLGPTPGPPGSALGEMATGMVGDIGKMSTPNIALQTYRAVRGRPNTLANVPGAAARVMGPVIVGGMAEGPTWTPGTGAVDRPAPVTEAAEPGLLGKAARHMPVVGKYLRAFDFVRDVLGAGKQAPEPPAPVAPPVPPEVGMAHGLRGLPWLNAKPAAETGEALATIKPNLPPPEQAVPRAVISSKLDTGLRSAVGNQPVRPGVPIGQQLRPQVPSPPNAEGYIPVKSDAVAAYKYDAPNQEFHVIAKDGFTHIYGEVSPAQAEGFATAESKGRAWQAIQQNNVKVAKISPAGVRTPSKGASQLRSANPFQVTEGAGQTIERDLMMPKLGATEDLTPRLQESLRAVKRARRPSDTEFTQDQLRTWKEIKGRL